ncbi:MAG: hypothetical protein AAGK37_02000 [Pseudomonadota bacterium]
MTDADQDILAVISPSPARLWVAIAMLTALAVVLLSIAVQMPREALLWQAMIVAIASVCVLGALRMYSATRTSIEMTRSEIRDTEGRLIARIDDITGIERGALAFKPSNGFLVKTHTSHPRAWVPGIWWRLGKFSGVGGITHGHQGKAMADRLAIILAERDSEAR